MIITFNRDTGKIISLGETFVSFNNKTITIDDLTHMKYVSMDLINKIPKIDKFGRDEKRYNGVNTSILEEVSNTEPGNVIFSKGNIEFRENKSTTKTKLQPVIEFDKVGKYYNFPSDYKMFNIDEIIKVYYQNKLEASDCTYGLGENFSYLKNILIHSSTFKSINRREIILSPGDHLKLKSENLASPSNTFKILDCNKDVSVYINDLEIDAILEFKKPIDKINISFKNNTNKDIILDNILIGYSKTTEM